MTKNKKNRPQSLQIKSTDSDDFEDSSKFLSDNDATTVYSDEENKINTIISDNKNIHSDNDISDSKENNLEINNLKKLNEGYISEINNLKQQNKDNQLESDRLLNKKDIELKQKLDLLDKEIDKNNLLTLENYELNNKVNELNNKINEQNDKINEQNAEKKDLENKLGEIVQKNSELNTKLNGQTTVDLLYKLKDSLLNKNKDIEKNVKEVNLNDSDKEGDNKVKNQEPDKTQRKSKKVNSLFFKYL